METIDTRQAYNTWSEQYDTNLNKTRDLEAKSVRTTLAGISFDNCLEIGCGTGKNTEWLISKAQHITAVDLSESMLAVAKAKINSGKVTFVQADITEDWNFASRKYDLVTFSLMLEHIENLNEVFRKAAEVTSAGAFIYVGELHPFKQYSGSKARFATEHGEQEVICFNHHVSEFVSAAKNSGFRVEELVEYFDDDNRAGIPRILTLLFKKTDD